jgi:diadenosine tetraphosphatase ApaH/serine/threonine PP2A family protein phosphatase
VYAVISDVHSNIEALGEVLADIDAHGVREIVCLGDVVGYGPNPLECVDMIMERTRVCLKGNHDEALVHGAYAFNLPARKAIDWTREQLRPRFHSGRSVKRRWEFLSSLPLRYEVGPALFTHGSPRDPTNEYILAQYMGTGPSERFEEIFAGIERMLFVGHTHLPCVITDGYETRTATELGNSFTLPDNQKVIVNVGSVGQPRDRDNRACYAIVDDDTITWRRVAYDFEKTASKIERIAELEPALAHRIKIGT